MLEKIYDDLVTIHVHLLEGLGKFSCTEVEDCPPSLRGLREAEILLDRIIDMLTTVNNVQARQYSYDDLYWMPSDFPDQVNSANLADRFCLLADAVSAWDALHSHLGRRAPICPLLDPTLDDPNADPSDF